MIRIGLIQFPGSNCERETALAVKRAGMEPVEFLWNEPLRKLQNFDGYILVGGFSYEDRSRAGIIAALDPVIQAIKEQGAQGKPVLGICNGAQILVEAGLVPDLANHQSGLTLTENKRIFEGKILGTGFYNSWVNLRLSDEYQVNAFTRHLSLQQIIKLPIAHGEGRFVMPETTLTALIREGLNLFQYCDEKGDIVDNFPINPNGSVSNIAAISNQAGNILAMMPHPERTANGDPIFHSMHDYIKEGKRGQRYISKSVSSCMIPQTFSLPSQRYECLTRLIIADNHALTVEKTLRNMGLPVTVRRFKHWEIECDSEETLKKIKHTGVLFCERKEQEVLFIEPAEQVCSYLIRAKEDLIGQQALATLKTHYAIALREIKHGIVWQFKSDNGNIAEFKDTIFSTNIMGNQYAHECFQYDELLSATSGSNSILSKTNPFAHQL
ncbi:phosphoribosylformylglycinamidine synthase I [Legionella clemsonensis]|uniref:Phosphoribosylformylglycinamidine synthase 1 n=1 Tax=Legionella clemsonensis TaxID=1867846 RepID=A0A222P4S2_9GAMM|nr:phosphoribosylformylglycinamidine synthase I [Legionella clemsonensis]ASQ46846.1 Phosphoribosylformylglycinamidine synthase 1 [Legionella clemsonensis]